MRSDHNNGAVHGRYFPLWNPVLVSIRLGYSREDSAFACVQLWSATKRAPGLIEALRDSGILLFVPCLIEINEKVLTDIRCVLFRVLLERPSRRNWGLSNVRCP